ncbi:MAG: LPS-assembly protein LptD [Gammaproteobacteria bacterium]|nr:LPS-assembly protein LptD [Gammaproteobacteria bacterium]
MKVLFPVTSFPVILRCIFSVLVGGLPLTSFAETDTLAGQNNCDGMTSSRSLPHLKPPISLLPDETHILADEVTARDGDLYTFNGNVHLFKNDLALSSDTVLYKESVESLEATGNVNLKRDNAIFFSSRLFYKLDKEKGQLDNVQFIFADNHARGNAERLNLINKDITELSATSYTTCEDEKPAWQLHARRLNLDSATNIGTATNVWIDFMRVPIFYLPYISFPLSGRKTGLLIPTIGSSSHLGYTTSVPYYLNLAPDRDATITLENFTKRGQRAIGEYRFLDEYDNGQVNVEYLPDDHVTDSDREYLAVSHKSQYLPRLTTNMDYRRASDKDYFEDFGDQLSIATVVHLESKAEALYQGNNWSLQSRVIEFQTLDNTIPDSSRPYKKRPEFTFNSFASEKYYHLLPEVRADYVRFDGKDRVSGSRLDLQPSVSMPFEGAPGFITPKVTLRHTQYTLDNQAVGSDDSPSRTLPIFSLDSGLFFERDLMMGKQSLIQTLEPRLFFLKVPFKDQSNLILDKNGVSRVFDTSLANQSFSQIFSENRFTGADRVADAKQVSLALTTRFLNAQSGVEMMSASIGRTQYYSDRRVTLPGLAPETETSSDFFAELRAKPFSSLIINSKVQWDNQQDKLRNSSFQLQYNDSRGRLLNFGYLTNRDNLGDVTQQESDISIFWPISHNWGFIGRRNYNHFENRSEEKLAGIEYDDCCWAFRVVSRRYVLNDQRNTSRSIMFQLELKGLTAIGKDVKSLLQNSQSGVSGY